MEGWIKLHRKVLENPIVCKDADYFAVWIYLLLNATHQEIDMVFKKERITLQPGQLITGRKSIAETLSINEYKVQRILKYFENEQQIAQQTSSQNRLISILKWNEYQCSEQQFEQQMHNECTTNAHKQECKNINIFNNNKEKKTDYYISIYKKHKAKGDIRNLADKMKFIHKMRNTEDYNLNPSEEKEIENYIMMN